MANVRIFKPYKVKSSRSSQTSSPTRQTPWHITGPSPYRSNPFEQLDGTIVQLKIEDNGPESQKEIAGSNLRPFFTTKQDVGTGLGLWVTKEIIERHNGSIHAGARLDGSPGAAFTIVLPAESPAHLDGRNIQRQNVAPIEY